MMIKLIETEQVLSLASMIHDLNGVKPYSVLADGAVH